jgi:hypothetical protein
MSTQHFPAPELILTNLSDIKPIPSPGSGPGASPSAPSPPSSATAAKEKASASAKRLHMQPAPVFGQQRPAVTTNPESERFGQEASNAPSHFASNCQRCHRHRELASVATNSRPTKLLSELLSQPAKPTEINTESAQPTKPTSNFPIPACAPVCGSP